MDVKNKNWNEYFRVLCLNNCCANIAAGQPPITPEQIRWFSDMRVRLRFLERNLSSRYSSKVYMLIINKPIISSECNFFIYKSNNVMRIVTINNIRQNLSKTFPIFAGIFRLSKSIIMQFIDNVNCTNERKTIISTLDLKPELYDKRDESWLTTNCTNKCCTRCTSIIQCAMYDFAIMYCSYW